MLSDPGGRILLPTLASVVTCTVENGAVLEKAQGCGAGAQCCLVSTNHFQPSVCVGIELGCCSWRSAIGTGTRQSSVAELI